MSIQLGAVNLRYVLPNGTPLFSGLTFSFGSGRIGLIGRNGVGKTTLLEILAGRRPPTEGEVKCTGRIAFLEQEEPARCYTTVADALHCASVLNAYARVTSDVGIPEDLDCLQHQWNLVDRVQQVLSQMGVGHIDVLSPFDRLSGGEQARIRLSYLLLSEPDFVFLDEPTNHLDHEARSFVYEWIQQSSKGLLVVSHDRRLLDLLNQIVVLDKKGVHQYGGNYTFYREQVEIERAAVERVYTHARKELKVVKKQAQDARERQERRSASGKRQARRTGVAPMAAGTMQRHAEKTAGKLAGKHEDKVITAREAERAAFRALDSTKTISIDLSSTAVPTRKIMVRAREILFRFDPGLPDVWENPLSFDIVGPERVAIAGCNGSGKSTLMKLIRGELSCTGGSLEIGVRSIAFLDQNIRVLHPGKTLIENVRRGAPDRSEHEIRLLLARFLFDAVAIEKPVDVLSGGERMRAGLVCLLCRDQAPDLLMLDEPANNLDLDSIEEMIGVLNQYKGTLLVVSHDDTFLEDIHIGRIIDLDAV